VADFSPDTALPPEWVRTRDPFQGVSKKAFGFTATITAAPPSATEPEVASTNCAPGNGGTGAAGLPRTDLADRRPRQSH